MPKRGYYFISDKTEWLPDMKELTLLDLVTQIESCDYSCIAGRITLNVAWMELRRRAELEAMHQEMKQGE